MIGGFLSLYTCERWCFASRSENSEDQAGDAPLRGVSSWRVPLTSDPAVACRNPLVETIGATISVAENGAPYDGSESTENAGYAASSDNDGRQPAMGGAWKSVPGENIGSTNRVKR